MQYTYVLKGDILIHIWIHNGLVHGKEKQNTYPDSSRFL